MANYRLVLSNVEKKVNVADLVNINETETTYFSHEHIVSLLKNQLKNSFMKNNQNYQIKVLHCIGGNRTIVNDKKTMEIKFQAYLEIEKFVHALSETERKKFFYTLNSIYIEINEEEGVIYIIDGQQRLSQFLTMALFVNVGAIFSNDILLSHEMQKLLSKDNVNDLGLISENIDSLNFVVETFNSFELEKTKLSNIKTVSDYQLMLHTVNSIMIDLQNEVNREAYFKAIIKKRTKKDKNNTTILNLEYEVTGLDLFLYRLDMYIKQYKNSSYLKYLKTSFELIIENLNAADLNYTHLVNSMYSTKIYIIEKSPFMTAGQCLTAINKPGAKMNNITDIMDLFGMNLKSNTKYFNNLNNLFLSILSKIDSSKNKESVMDNLAQIISANYSSVNTFVSKAVDSQINIASVIKIKIDNIKKQCIDSKSSVLDSVKFTNIINDMAIEFLTIMDNFLDIQNLFEGSYPLLNLVDYLEKNKIHFRNSLTILEIYRLGIESGMKEKTAFTYCPLLFELKKESLSKINTKEIFCLTKESEKILHKILLRENTFFLLEKTEVNTLKSKEANFFNITRILMDSNELDINVKLKSLNDSNEFRSGGVFAKSYSDLQSVILAMGDGNYHSNKKNDIGIHRSVLMGFEKVIRMSVNSHFYSNNNYGLDKVITEDNAIKKVFDRELDFVETFRHIPINDKAKRDKALEKSLELDHMLAKKASKEGNKTDEFIKYQDSNVFKTFITKEKNRNLGNLDLINRKAGYASEECSAYKIMFNIKNQAFTDLSESGLENMSKIMHELYSISLTALLIDVLDNCPKNIDYTINECFDIK